ncbi:hypothetical protein JHD46_08185 [Sulfurimonas sp. SAG-AH-194-C20]|nr:hypothetical protein [Sulfurimonas sp. SAG-AH-194-C20]MDF1879613.1 hypothetical protein [Sulfurimonas sp. SAG-AH-194-C20]
MQTSTVEIYSSKPITPGANVYGPEYSGQVIASSRSTRVSGTPYFITQITSLGGK